MINLSFGERKNREGARQIFLDGQLLRGATAHIYEASKMGDRLIPQFTGANFHDKSVDAIRSFAVADLFTQVDHLTIRILMRQAITEPDSWRFSALRISPKLTKRTDQCQIYIPVDFNADKWDRHYSITDLATWIHQALNQVQGNYWFQQYEPGSLVMGFGLYISFPVHANIGDILAKVIPDLEEIASYARGILETKALERVS